MMKKFLRLQVKHQGGVLQADWVAADSVVDCMTGGEGWSAPVQKYSGGTVSLGIQIVWRRWRWHQAISNSYRCIKSNVISPTLLRQVTLQMQSRSVLGLTDTSRGADSLVCLVAISNEIVRQKFNVVLLPRVCF